jgi:hypothetical protein
MMIWAVVWMCTFKGVGLTGRVIYVTMALPLVEERSHLHSISPGQDTIIP